MLGIEATSFFPPGTRDYSKSLALGLQIFERESLLAAAAAAMPSLLAGFPAAVVVVVQYWREVERLRIVQEQEVRG